MEDFSPLRQAYYGFLGRAYSLTYHTHWLHILGFALSSWIKFLSLVLFLMAFGLGWELAVIGFTLLLLVLIWFLYGWAEKQGYMRFVPDDKAIPPLEDDTLPLPNGARISLYASGVYAVVDREERVLLRPSEYWRSPSGEHGVMVNQYSKKYLYQFFQADLLQSVQPGWLIFGKAPLPTLAITFWQTWGPDNADDVSTYTVGGGEKENKNRKKRTIYFTFEDPVGQQQVTKKLLADIPVTH